jgi:hypothetical protein
MVIDVYSQYFKAECEANGVMRRGALVKLTSDSEAGSIRYTVSVTFFPHADDEDYAVSYDAYAERVIFEGRGRRSKKREAAFMKTFRADIDVISEELGGKVLWDEPLRDPRYA